MLDIIIVGVIGVSYFWEEHVTSVRILPMSNLLHIISEFIAVAMFVFVGLWSVHY
jgi:hypothetical protein